MQTPRWSISAAWPVVLALGVAACGQTVGGNKPVGKTEDTDAELQRYLRRTYLDLAGHGPSDTELDDATARLRTANNTAASPGALVDDLIAKDAFASVWAGELENAIAAGAGPHITGTLDLRVNDIGALTATTMPRTCADLGVQPLAAETAVFCVVLTDAAGHRGGGDCTLPIAIAAP